MANNAWLTLMAGFTTVQSVGASSEAPLRDAIRDRGFPGPRVLTSLSPIQGDSTIPGDSLRAMVRRRKGDGRGSHQDLRIEESANRRRPDVQRGTAPRVVRRSESGRPPQHGPRVSIADWRGGAKVVFSTDATAGAHGRRATRRVRDARRCRLQVSRGESKVGSFFAESDERVDAGRAIARNGARGESGDEDHGSRGEQRTHVPRRDTIEL